MDQKDNTVIHLNSCDKKQVFFKNKILMVNMIAVVFQLG